MPKGIELQRKYVSFGLQRLFQRLDFGGSQLVYVLTGPSNFHCEVSMVQTTFVNGAVRVLSLIFGVTRFSDVSASQGTEYKRPSVKETFLSLTQGNDAGH
jgi:hypothetical protein